MYYTIIELTKGKRISIIFYFVFTYFIFILSLIGLIETLLNFNSFDYYAFSPYYENPVIRKIYITFAVCCFVFMIWSAYYALFESKLLKFKIFLNADKFLIAACTIIVLFLTWYELYFGSTIEYSNRDKHNLVSFLILPSICIAFTTTVFLKEKIRKDYIIIILFLVISILSFYINKYFFKMFALKWNLWYY